MTKRRLSSSKLGNQPW